MAPDNISDELTDTYEFVSYQQTLKAMHLLAKFIYTPETYWIIWVLWLFKNEDGICFICESGGI